MCDRKVPSAPVRRAAGVALALLVASALPAAAQGLSKGQTSGLPLPRFASIKSQPTNIRQGPSKEHEVAWTFMRAGIPIEITQEFDTWYRVRDAEGQEGWVQKALLSGKRTAFVAPWEKQAAIPLRDGAGSATVVANLEPNVLVEIRDCDGSWCRVTVEGTRGFVEQARLWGIYPAERYPAD
jgi:SH3-like domain-containing protein